MERTRGKFMICVIDILFFFFFRRIRKTLLESFGERDKNGRLPADKICCVQCYTFAQSSNTAFHQANPFGVFASVLSSFFYSIAVAKYEFF